MRCPKCHYLSFEPDPRCKNCGYDLDVEPQAFEEPEESPTELRFAPAESAPPLPPLPHDLPLRSAEPPSRPMTLEIVRPLPALAPVPERLEPALALVGVAAEPPAVRRAPPRVAPPTTELPLFVKTMGPQDFGAFAGLATDTETEEEVDDPIEPVNLPPSREPLSVRRPVVDTVRTAPRIDRRPGPLDHDLLEDLHRLEREEAIRTPRSKAAASVIREQAVWPDDRAGDAVALSTRFGAAALDGLLLGGIGAFVLWATLRVAEATPADLTAAALVPMAIFLAGVGIAYLLMFTAAGGQTVGKMLMGIRVVGEEGSESERVTIGQAASRAVLAPLSLAALGMGWLPTLIGRGPALHDRLSHTRVVRA